jgi:hypothetical protein
MLVFVWRGAGILVPIAFFVSGWLTSYYFEDPRMGNAPYMFWTLLWAGIIVTLAGLVTLPISKDEETGKWRYIGNHDFLWVPMIIWGIVFLYFCFKFSGSETPKGADTKPITTESQVENKDYPMNENNVQADERMINFYNPSKEPITITFTDDAGVIEEVSGEIIPLGSTFIVAKKGNYTVSYGDNKKKIKVTPSTKQESYDADEMWIILGNDLDFLLVDVTETAYASLEADDLIDMNWMDEVYARYKGNAPIAMNIEQEKGLYFKVYDPYYSIPTTHTKEEQFYTIIPIPKNIETSNDFIAEYLRDLLFKTENHFVHGM